MADYSDPKRGVAYRFTMSLFAQSDNQIKTTPTLAAGDVKVSKDNGATANITTLPSEAPAGSGILQVDLSATEMTADLVTVTFIDAAGSEWNSAVANIAPTVRQLADLAYPATSGRSMVVDANGLVDANTVKVGPTGSGTAQTAGDIIGDTNDIQTRLPAALVSGRIDASVGAMASGVLTATAIAADAITDAKVASDVTIASVTGAVGSVTGNVGGNVTGSVGSVVGNVGGNVVGSVASVTAGVTLAASAVQAIWDALTSALTTVGSIGKLLVDNINATISSRLASASYTAPLDAAGTRTAIGLASANLDTQLDALPTNAELATALGTADDAVLAAIAALTIPSAAANAAAVLAAAFEGAETVQDFLRLSRAALYGKASGLDTTTAIYRDAADTKPRITAVVTADGNRTAVTLDAT